MRALLSSGDHRARCGHITKRGVAWGAALLLVACTDSPPAGPNPMYSAVTVAADVGTPVPTLLPVATGQTPNNAAYDALSVPGQPAGFSYNDPVTGVKIWKVTSPTVPLANPNAGHDYADGPNEVSLGWGPNGNTHTILIGAPPSSGNYYVVDFTPGVGLSDYRKLTVQPRMDLAASFSNVPGNEHILYIMTHSQIVRYNTAKDVMNVENIASFPLNQALQNWLQHDKNDEWFVGLVDATTAFAWNSRTNQYLTHPESWLNEGRLERDGRYVALTNGNTQFRQWDLLNNSFGPVQSSSTYWFAHNADLRTMWVTTDVNDVFGSAPMGLIRYYPSGGQIALTRFLGTSAGYGVHHSGNWVQSDAELGGDLNKQWSFVSGFNYASTNYTANAIWKDAVGLVRSDGSDARLLLHHYSRNVSYYDMPWGQPSPDGQVVIFNSNMNGSGRIDLFVAEMPLSGSPPPPPPSTQNVVWTNLTNVTANGNSITKTSTCDGCEDAGAISSQTITSGDGYVEFRLPDHSYAAAGLSNGNTNQTRIDIDFAISSNAFGRAEVWEDGSWKHDTTFVATDVFRVESVGATVRYSMNGQVFWTSTKLPTYPLLLDTSIGTPNASINNAVISGQLN